LFSKNLSVELLIYATNRDKLIGFDETNRDKLIGFDETNRDKLIGFSKSINLSRFVA
jgi:hypothetical protein